MMNIQVTTNPSAIELEQWDSFIRKHPDGNFFQSPKAFELFNNSNYYKPFVIFQWENEKINSVLTGATIVEKGIPSYFSRRTIIWGGPVTNNKEESLTKNLLIRLCKISRHSIYIEFRNIFDMNEFKILFEKQKFKYKRHLNFHVKTTNLEQQKKKISKSKIRQIKSSINNGAIIEEAKTKAEVNQFYSILFDLYHKKIKKPLPPLSFFEEFFNQNDIGKILLVKHKETIVGGIVCPIFMNRIIYEWFIAGMDGKLNGIYPSVMATWAPIEFALNNGFDHFDFLGAGSPNTNYGVREFKSKFGGELVEFGRFIKINKPILYNIGKFGLEIKKRIK